LIRASHHQRKAAFTGLHRSEMRVRLNELPEEAYAEALWRKKVDAVWILGLAGQARW
jgi:hypothetical protein